MSKCGNNKILSRSNKDGVEWFEAVLRIRIRRNSIILQDPDLGENVLTKESLMGDFIMKNCPLN